MSDTAPEVSSFPHVALSRLAMALILLVITAAIFLRLYALDRLPGVNGDEAWYGVKAQHYAAGTLTDWRTPTGNLPGPLQMGWLAVLQTMFAPSVWLLRLPTVISSIAAMALAYLTARRFFGVTSAVAALLMMAALPANIVYARFGWDPSHSGLIILIAAFLALDRRLVWSALAFAFALWVHPTNVFAAPFLVLAFAGAEYQDGLRDRAPLQVGLYVALLIAALAVLTITAEHVASGQAWGAGGGGGGGGGVAMLAQAKDWLLFAPLFVQFLSGETVFTYLAGDGYGAAQPLADGVTAAVLAALLAFGVPRLWPDGISRTSGVVAGWLASLGGFSFIAGSAALLPGEDRYALCLVVPTVMAVAVLIGAVARAPRHRAIASLAMAAVALAALAGVWLRYLDPLASGRGGAHRAFWTGPVEPKQAALALIAADARGAPATIVAEDWWTYWPIAYFANGRYTMIQSDDPRGAAPVKGLVYYVGFRGRALDCSIEQRTPGRTWDVPALNPAEQLWVWKAEPSSGTLSQSPSRSPCVRMRRRRRG